VIGRIEHREAMALTAVDNQRCLGLLRMLGPQDWSQPTDCTRWDVRAVVAHLVDRRAARRHRASSCIQRVGAEGQSSTARTALDTRKREAST
jgi:hypothetical protein